MSKTLLAAVVVSGMLSLAARAQTTPAGSKMAGTTKTSAGSTTKTSQANSGNMAPNRSSTAGSRTVSTSNNPVDATGKPVGTTQPTTTSPGKTSKPKN